LSAPRADVAFDEDVLRRLDPAEKFSGISRRVIGQARIESAGLGRIGGRAKVLLKPVGAVEIARSDLDVPTG
jgi:hypothetical protein